MVLGYTLFLLGPIIMALWLSFTNWSIIEDFQFIGLENYKEMFANDPIFWQTVGNTLYFSVGLIPLNLVLALSLALLLNRNIPGIGIFRTIIFTPVVTSIIIWSIVWKYIFSTDSGFVNQLLKILFNIDGPAWLYHFKLAMPVVIVVTVLKGVGMNMVIFLAALQDVPRMYYEAARIDGASRWQQFRNVTLPLITPSVFLAFILTLIGSLKVFSQIYVLTGGGPGRSTYVLVYYIYQKAFKEFEFGYGSAVAFFLFVIILILTLIQWHLRKKWVHYEQ